MTWNTAAIRKLVWDLAAKKDNLWVRWISGVYLGAEDFWGHECPPSANWQWKKLCEVRDRFASSYLRGKWLGESDGIYNIRSGYTWLVGDQRKLDLQYVLWHNMNLPRHSFILWVAVQKRLLTLDRLSQWIPSITGGELCSVWRRSRIACAFVF